MSVALCLLILSADDLLETFSVDAWREGESFGDVATVKGSKSRRKRSSSEVFPDEVEPSFDEAAIKKKKIGRSNDAVDVVFNKENVRKLQIVHYYLMFTF